MSRNPRVLTSSLTIDKLLYQQIEEKGLNPDSATERNLLADLAVVALREYSFSTLQAVAGMDFPSIDVNQFMTHDVLIRLIAIGWAEKVAEARREPQFRHGDAVRYKDTSRSVRVIPPDVVDMRVVGTSKEKLGQVQVDRTRRFWVAASSIEKVEAAEDF